MKKIYLFFTLLIALSACDEGGILITVPSVGNYQFAINSATANGSANNSYITQQTVDPSALFTEDSDRVKNITLNNLKYQISGYSGTAGNDVLMNFSLSTVLDGNTTEVLSATGVSLTNGLFTAFEKGKSSLKVSAAQAASIEAIIGNQESFDLILTTSFNKGIESDFNIEVVLDITGSISEITN